MVSESKRRALRRYYYKNKMTKEEIKRQIEKLTLKEINEICNFSIDLYDKIKKEMLK